MKAWMLEKEEMGFELEWILFCDYETSNGLYTASYVWKDLLPRIFEAVLFKGLGAFT